METTIATQGDFTVLARLGTPTEAQLLKGMLAAAGIAAEVADAHLVQANHWMTQAVGGVRVLVREAQLAEAQEVMSAFESGELDLEPPSAAAPFETPSQALYSIDRAALLSVLLTPLFGFAIDLINSRRLGQPLLTPGRLFWGLLLLASTAFAVAVVQLSQPGAWMVLRASLMLTFPTAFWYVLHGREQSALLHRRFGPKFRRASWAPVVLVALGLELLVGWGLSLLQA